MSPHLSLRWDFGFLDSVQIDAKTGRADAEPMSTYKGDGISGTCAANTENLRMEVAAWISLVGA